MKKSIVLVIVFLVCLTITGVAYAAWTQNIELAGTVTTGTFDIQWLDAGTTTQSPDGVATITSVRTNVHTLTVTVTNAFPGWTGTVDCTVKNEGSIPVKLSGPTYAGDTTILDVTRSLDTATALAPGNTRPVTVSIEIPMESVPEQNHTYSFTLTVEGQQFNATP